MHPRSLRVGVVGFGWMGQVHARAYARLRQHYPQSPLAPTLVAVADNAADTRLAQAVAAYGFTETHADWRDLVARDDLERRLGGPQRGGAAVHAAQHALGLEVGQVAAHRGAADPELAGQLADLGGPAGAEPFQDAVVAAPGEHALTLAARSAQK